MNSSTKKNDEILKAIVYLQSKKTIKSRNVTLKDLMIYKNNYNSTKNNDQIKSFRIQEEFGPKKRIKP